MINNCSIMTNSKALILFDERLTDKLNREGIANNPSIKDLFTPCRLKVPYGIRFLSI